MIAYLDHTDVTIEDEVDIGDAAAAFDFNMSTFIDIGKKLRASEKTDMEELRQTIQPGLPEESMTTAEPVGRKISNTVEIITEPAVPIVSDLGVVRSEAICITLDQISESSLASCPTVSPRPAVSSPEPKSPSIASRSTSLEPSVPYPHFPSPAKVLHFEDMAEMIGQLQLSRLNSSTAAVRELSGEFADLAASIIDSAQLVEEPIDNIECVRTSSGEIVDPANNMSVGRLGENIANGILSQLFPPEKFDMWWQNRDYESQNPFDFLVVNKPKDEGNVGSITTEWYIEVKTRVSSSDSVHQWFISQREIEYGLNLSNSPTVKRIYSCILIHLQKDAETAKLMLNNMYFVDDLITASSSLGGHQSVQFLVQIVGGRHQRIVTTRATQQDGSQVES